jgi:hypothetical protein
MEFPMETIPEKSIDASLHRMGRGRRTQRGAPDYNIRSIRFIGFAAAGL